MTCYRPGERSRLVYAVREYRGRKDEPKGFGWRDFRDLFVRARTQLGSPIVLVWDNVRLHLTKPLWEFIDANATWLTVFQLPTYAPGLNPQEGIGHWSSATPATPPQSTRDRSRGSSSVDSSRSRTARTWSTAASLAQA
ncbi:transposase [Streptomyces sp. Wh19]|nr:transposase [Streptomyces sp. Wh19]MDV9194584.1 transposase [Streptomyces sp. Wh19]